MVDEQTADPAWMAGYEAAKEQFACVLEAVAEQGFPQNAPMWLRMAKSIRRMQPKVTADE